MTQEERYEKACNKIFSLKEKAKHTKNSTVRSNLVFKANKLSNQLDNLMPDTIHGYEI